MIFYRQPKFAFVSGDPKPGSTYSKTGVVIQDMSEVPSEFEVLFRPGTSFNVLEKVFDHPVKGMRFIQIEEIDPT